MSNKVFFEMDELPNKEKIRPTGKGFDRKSLNENLNPLVGFLDKSVGRKWDDVYSEIRKNISVHNATQMHVIQHLHGYVDTKTWIEEDGKIYAVAKYSRNVLCLTEPTFSKVQFYVHPITRTLCQSPKLTPRVQDKQIKLKKPRVVKVSDKVQYRFIDEEWYRVEFGIIPKEFGKDMGVWVGKHLENLLDTKKKLSYAHVGDVLFPNGFKFDWQREEQYGFSNLWVVEKRRVGKRERKTLMKEQLSDDLSR